MSELDSAVYPSRDKPVRVLYLVSNPFLDSAWSVLSLIINHGPANGVEPVVLFDTHTVGRVGVDEHTVPVLRLPLRKVGLIRLTRSLVALRKLVRDRRIDIVHINGDRSTLVPTVMLRLTTGTPFVFHHHGRPVWWSRTQSWMMRVVGALAGANIAVSEFISDELRRDARFAPRKVTWVTNRVDTNRFSPSVDGTSMRAELGFSAQAVAVVEAARIYKMKRQEDLVRAIAIARRSDPRLEVAIVGWEYNANYEGRFPTYGDELAALAEELGVVDAVHFRDARPEAPELHAAADICCLPSVDDPCPLGVLEAMATGRPFVGTRSGGIPWMVEEGVDGLLVAPKAPEELAEALVRLAADEQLRHEMGARARAHAVERFDASTAGSQVAAVYRAVLARAPLPPGS